MTPNDLHTLIAGRLRASPGSNLDDVLRSIAQELADSPEQLRACWDVLGPWWLQAAYQQVVATLNGQREVPLPALQEGPRRMNSLPNSRAERAPSWREKVDPLEVTMPVGNTGRRKRLGDFTREDVLAVRESYVHRARGAEAMAKAWHDVAERMSDQDTLRTIADREELVRLGVAPADRHLVPVET